MIRQRRVSDGEDGSDGSQRSRDSLPPAYYKSRYSISPQQVPKTLPLVGWGPRPLSDLYAESPLETPGTPRSLLPLGAENRFDYSTPSPLVSPFLALHVVRWC